MVRHYTSKGRHSVREKKGRSERGTTEREAMRRCHGGKPEPGERTKYISKTKHFYGVLYRRGIRKMFYSDLHDLESDSDFETPLSGY